MPRAWLTRLVDEYGDAGGTRNDRLLVAGLDTGAEFAAARTQNTFYGYYAIRAWQELK